MASEVSICNVALGRIGISQTINDLTDQNTQARQCNALYPDIRDQVLEDYPWNFAQKCEALALVDGVTIPGWGYVYRYPANAQRAQVVTTSAGARLPYTYLGAYCGEFVDYNAWYPLIGRVPFRVMADPVTPEARIIVCDIEDAYLWYADGVTNVNLFSALFRSAVAWRLAMDLALSLRADANLYKNAQQQYIWSVSQAQVASSSELQPDPEPISSAERSRW